MRLSWRDAIAAGRPIILDGAVGSELQRRGVAVDPICWSARAALTHFETLAAIHAAHIEAGAHVITTNTFAMSRYVLQAAGLADEFERITKAAVDAARQACERCEQPVAIAGSMSCLPPAFDTRNYPARARERDAYRELAARLAELRVDVLVLEMMQDTEHAMLALEAALETGLDVWLGLSCRQDSASGALVGFDFPETRFEAVATSLLAASPALVNVMHTPVVAVPIALARLRAIWDGPLGAYPELGTFDPVSRRRGGAIEPSELAELARGWHRDGAAVLGGCCGARPAHIAALSAALA